MGQHYYFEHLNFPANPALLGQHYYFKPFSHLTKQYYFTAKIMLKYCSGESRYTRWRRIDFGLPSDCRRHSCSRISQKRSLLAVFTQFTERFTVKAHPSFIWGGRGEGNDEFFSQLTKQCYFTAKIMLKYFSGEYPL